MRSIKLFTNQDASVAATSAHVNFEKRAEWMLTITSTGLNGVPRVVIECTIDNSEGNWTPLENADSWGTYYFPIDDSPISIIDDRLMGKFYRVRIEPNGNEQGTITADLGYKTYP